MLITLKVLTDKLKLNLSDTAMPLQKSDFPKYSILMFSHFTMEAVLGAKALIIGKKTAVKNQRKQTDLSMLFFLVLKSW